MPDTLNVRPVVVNDSGSTPLDPAPGPAGPQPAEALGPKSAPQPLAEVVRGRRPFITDVEFWRANDREAHRAKVQAWLEGGWRTARTGAEHQAAAVVADHAEGRMIVDAHLDRAGV